MGMFRRSEPEVIATGVEVDAAARQLQQGGSDALASELVDRAGPKDRQHVAMEILARAADYEPND